MLLLYEVAVKELGAVSEKYSVPIFRVEDA
jgi:hypothetical protein